MPGAFGLAYLKPFDAQACDSLSNLIEHPIGPSLGLTVDGVLGDASVLQPTREQLAGRLRRVELDAVTDEEEEDDSDASDDENDNDSTAEEAAVEEAQACGRAAD